ncbi:beta-lactamase-like protein [Mucor mucedo]|uniref:beta-lactamase-like protein n=1 Tax=Mucor mucedo TaxID=29922 RepID=UPI00221F2524|nr:beta-lactamase-like protein [Mucor mucedo]KAI7888121.1 beta-lactamase-like protein [Mucor mucedo]
MSTLSSAKQVNSAQLQAWLSQEKKKVIANGITIVDVREHDEVEQHGKIKGAINVPFKLDTTMFLAALSDINKHSKVVFQCMSGRRSDSAAILASKHGFEDTYSLSGGLKEWDGPIQPFMNNHSPWVHTLFDADTETAQYVVTDLATKEAYIIDPVLNYDPFASTVQPLLAKQLMQHVEKYGLNVSKIIDTHVHADHLTGAFYLKSHLPTKPEFWMGKDVTRVQEVFSERYNLDKNELETDGSQFDKLVHEGMEWTLGKDIHCSVLATPGHTPACMSYRIGDAAFVGDTLFMPDIGTARCDFPGGSAETMYESIHKMYNHWPDDTRIYVGHDYPPADRPYNVMTSLENHKLTNKMINSTVTLEEYTKMRKERDSKLKAPRYIHPSIQTNLRGGILPTPEISKHEKDVLRQFFKIPVRFVSS